MNYIFVCLTHPTNFFFSIRFRVYVHCRKNKVTLKKLQKNLTNKNKKKYHAVIWAWEARSNILDLTSSHFLRLTFKNKCLIFINNNDFACPICAR